MVRAFASHARGRWFESSRIHFEAPSSLTNSGHFLVITRKIRVSTSLAYTHKMTLSDRKTATKLPHTATPGRSGGVMTTKKKVSRGIAEYRGT